jgi:hypothetical protein
LLKDWKARNISYYEYLQSVLSNKKYLFFVLSLAFFSIILYPLIIPHLSHPSMIYHIAIHIISFDVALFLSFVSAMSFRRTKSKKVLLTSLSFGVLLFLEFLYLLESSGILGEFHLPYIDIEVSHILLLVMLSLFAIGILKVERK